MHRLTRRIAAVCVTLTTLVGAWTPAAAAPTDAERAARAIGFIATQQNPNGSVPAFSPIGSTADAVLAIVAAGVGAPTLRRALGYLERQTAKGNVDTVGLRAKVILAAEAGGARPRSFGGHNLVRELREAYASSTGEGVFDTALAVLALRAADAPVPARAIRLLRREQCPDGGWPFDRFHQASEDEHCFSGDPSTDFFLSETNATALVVMALRTTRRGLDGLAADPFAFFRQIRDPDRGGWGYSWGFQATDANSTALVLQAFAAVGRRGPTAARQALRDLQYARCGAFAYTFDADRRGDPNLGATIGAVPGLLGLAFPYEGAVRGPAPETPDCA
ncbi:MAG: hypothetical protein KatS3mg013_1617 [Actinomycetota bacterium]|jgi:hypothetical protein|nr:MAG: hypothetical protein KatS3mg013_1617 [Actinomycetota bacterium]